MSKKHRECKPMCHGVHTKYATSKWARLIRNSAGKCNRDYINYVCFNQKRKKKQHNQNIITIL